ncbi:protein PTHB1 [Neocloeon triangulifer]|uniref:protein PTHB1 n=1 Tax=Neocloeon triangulifer TaxID=2078957 RepID=UPI00286FAB4C|nr:protein PTHB1 [Neocloeon triangulifer]
MSLFRCRLAWSQSLGDGDDQCGQNCLIVTSDLTNDSNQELLVVGSYAGMLRVFRPSLSPAGASQPSDLILEKQLGYPILALSNAILRSGMKNHQLAVMSTQCVAVFNIVIAFSNSDLAASCKLEFCFERPISESLGTCWQLVVGKFGGGDESKSGLASIGIVTSGGALAVFERESREPLIVKLFSPDSTPLLGSTVAYSSMRDSFIIVSASWEMQMHKYSSLVKTARDSANRQPDWSIILADPVIDLQVVNQPNDGPGILVVGQRSLTFWQWSGVTKFSRRLPFSPLCVSHHFAEECLMVLVANETLLLFRDGQLCWSSQLPYPIVCISTTRFQGTPGYLAMLSDSLDLQISYLGTEPAMFGTPTQKEGFRANMTIEMMTEELNRINARLKSFTTAAPTSQGDLKVSVIMAKRATRGAIRLSVVAPISLLSLSVMVSKPIEASPKSVSISSLCDSVEIPLTFTINSDSTPPTSMDVDICASYAQADGTPQIIQTGVTKLPLSMLLFPAREAAKDETHKLNFLFLGPYNDTVRAYIPGMQSGGGTAHFSGSFGNITVHCSPGDPSKCSIQSNSVTLLSLVASSVLGTPGLLPTVQKSPEPLQWLLNLIDGLFEKRKERDGLMEELKNKTYWARQVQFSLLTRYRDQTATVLNGMDTLLMEAFQQINELSNKISAINQELEKQERQLGCAIKLCCQLLRLSENPPKTELLEAIEASVSSSFIHKNWVEHTTSALEHLILTLWSSTGIQRGFAAAQESQPTKIKSIFSKVFSALQ